MKKNKLKLIRIFCVILVLLIIIILLIDKKEENNYREVFQYINSDQWNEEKYPTGLPILIDVYEGELKAQNIGKSLFYVANEFIPEINSKLQGAKERDIRKYYNANKKEILMILGGINEEEFVLLVKEIIKIKYVDAKFEKYYFDIESIIGEKNSVTGDLNIKYENCDEIKIKINVIGYFKNEVSSVKYYK